MPAKIFSAATLGLESRLIEVEIDTLSSGLHNFTLVGLPDTATREAKERVSAAIKNSGFKPPHQCGRIVVNLAPADIPKNGPIYDLPIALGFLSVTDQIRFDISNRLFVGELSLDGSVRPIHGVLPIAIMAKENGFSELFVPRANVQEAAMVDGLRIFPVDTLLGLAGHFAGTAPIEPFDASDTLASDMSGHTGEMLDFQEIRGQEHAKRALEIAAAGGHNVLLSGPPGSGKTLLAKSLPSILPALSQQESLEVTKIFSVSGKLERHGSLVTRRPFRAPHHSASAVSLVGGGSYPRPGEISLAHRGVLFLDEFAEFPKSVIEHLRQPLEDGHITVARAKDTVRFPAQFILVAATNPCPCGNLSDPERLCSCTSTQILNYQRKISGPILDRIDLHVEVPRLKISHLDAPAAGKTESSVDVQRRVQDARNRQEKRFSGKPIRTNSEMTVKNIAEYCPLDDDCRTLLHQTVESMRLSARAYHRLIKLSRTIADLDGVEQIRPNHVAEAIQYRFRENQSI